MHLFYAAIGFAVARWISSASVVDPLAGSVAGLL